MLVFLKQKLFLSFQSIDELLALFQALCVHCLTGLVPLAELFLVIFDLERHFLVFFHQILIKSFSLS